MACLGRINSKCPNPDFLQKAAWDTKDEVYVFESIMTQKDILQ